MRVRYSFSSRRTGNIENISKQKEKFPKIVKEIIKISDIVLEVLDSRFLAETRNSDVEKEVLNNGKELIYVLNKSDLVNTKDKLKEIKRIGLEPFLFVSCKKRKGILRLRNKIKEEVKRLRKEGKVEHERAQVGIIGYPNTGKSSLINMLAGRSSAGVGSQAGFTKGMQRIRLSGDIHILDTPGVIPEEDYSHTKKELIQKQSRVGARTIDKIKEPDIVVLELMRTNSKDIEKYYGIDAGGNVEVLIDKVGRKKNFLKKGGNVDEDRTLKMIIKDWQQGKIKI